MIRNQSTRSSVSWATRGSAVMISESGVLAASSPAFTIFFMISRSVTMPVTLLSASTITTEPNPRSDMAATAEAVMSSAVKVNGRGLLAYSGRSRKAICVRVDAVMLGTPESCIAKAS